MEKIKENLALFFIVWGVVLFLNQIIIFRSCFTPQCLIAALPHTGVITFLLFILIIKSDKKVGLRKQLKMLEEKFQMLIEQKIEYINSIENFNTQYNIHLGELIKTILNLKKEILYKKVIQNQKLKEEYEEAKSIYEEFDNEYKNIDEIPKILLNLEGGTTFKTLSNDIDNEVFLKINIQELEKNIINLEKEIKVIKEDDTFKIISTLKNSDYYFEQLKIELEKERILLEDEAKNILDEKINKKVILEQVTQIKDVRIKKEVSKYSKVIKDIENPNFEKIRRYCNNLLNDNQADDMQKYLAVNGKMYKALMYDAFEEFLAKINSSSINIIDFGCNQGINSLLLFDYIREKQLDIEIKNVLLVDDNTELLERAKTHVEVFKNNNTHIKLINDFQELLEFDIDTNMITINLCFNDEFIKKININNLFIENSYCICISTKSKEYNDKIYDIFKFNKIITNKEKKIGKFKKYELIFNIESIPF
jgi:hypothetical protein